MAKIEAKVKGHEKLPNYHNHARYFPKDTCIVSGFLFIIPFILDT